MLDSIKSRLEKNENRDEIKKTALELLNSPVWQEVINLFQVEHPLQINCECGQPMKTSVQPFTLDERVYCPDCLEKREREVREKEKSEIRKSLLSRADIVLKDNGAPQMFLKANISDFPASVKKYINIKKGLYVFGDRGCGKTHLAVSLMRAHLDKVGLMERASGFEIIQKTIPMFASVPEMLMDIRHAYSDSKASEKSIIEKYAERDFLVLDDMGVEKVTEWTMQMLYIIIDKRYRDEKRTIITSNLTLDGLAEKLDDRVASRIAGMCILVPMQGRDRRLTNKGE